MEQDIAIRLMMLEIERDNSFVIEVGEEIIKKYLNLMYVVGFDAGRRDVYSRYSKKKTAVIQRDKHQNRIARYESVALAAKSTSITTGTIFEAMKKHWLTKDGYYWEKVS